MKFIITILFLVSFYGVSAFSNRPCVWLSLIIMSVFTYRNWNKHDKLENIIVIYSLFVLCSCIFSHFVNEQPLMTSIEGSRYDLGLLSYFVAKGFCPSGVSTKSHLRPLMLTTILCYIVQWIAYPVVLFAGSINDFDISVDNFRMRFFCSMLFYLAFLYGINEYITKRRILYLLYTILGFIPIIIMGFRSLVFLIPLSGILLIFTTIKKKIANILKFATICLIAGYSALQIPLVQDKIQEMKIRQENGGTFTDEDYVRNVGLVYYSSTFGEDPVMWALGGGSPQVSPDETPKNDYQKIFTQAYDKKLYWNDLGLIGFSYIRGIIATLILIYLCIRTMFYCKAPCLQYIRFCIFAVLLGTIITSMELYRNGNLVILGVLINIVHYSESRKILSKN